MNIDQAMSQIRPILSIIGSILIAVGLAKFFGFSIPMRGSGLEIAIVGFLTKHI